MIIIEYRDIYLLMVLLERLGLLAAGRVFPKIVSISEGVLGRRRSTGSETFSPLIFLEANKIVWLEVFALKETIYHKTLKAKPPPKNARSSVPVDVRCSETSFVMLPNIRNLAESLKFQGDK